jgi:3-hydroxybutyryl-CoA dehydrogenase
MEKIAIIGAGLMGHGLALVFASAGHAVTITDPVAEARTSVKERIAATLMALERDETTVDRVTVRPTLDETVHEADIVIEAAPERLELKQELFASLEETAPTHALLCSNTSVIPIGRIATRVSSKHRVLGTHWWNPPYLVPLVEVIETEGTDPANVARVMELLTRLRKVPVHVRKDVPGFVGNRLQHALWREAISLVEKGVCDAETVDLVVKNSFGLRLPVLGPLENAYLVGTDLTLDIHNQVLADLEDSHMPSPLLKALVAEGKLGFKSNEGFKSWDDDSKAALREKLLKRLKAATGI